MTRLWLATQNRGKVRELQALLPNLDIRSIDPDLELPDETGETFTENARIKAEFVAESLGEPSLADDSGLCVDELGGAPGVRSARFAPGSDADRCAALLAALGSAEDRRAHFTCALALARPGRPTVFASGRCDGRIALEPSGTGGFGYDPIFVPDGETRTMAELSSAEKNARSHRAAALAVMLHHLSEL